MIEPLHLEPPPAQQHVTKSRVPPNLDVASSTPVLSNDIPGILARVTEFAAGHARTETVIADTDGLVLEGVGKVILAFGHGADKDADTFVGFKSVDVISDSNDVGVKTQGDFPAVRGEVVGDGVFDDLEQLFLRVDGPNGQPVQQLDHKTGEPFECSRNPHGRTDFDQDTFGGVDVDLQPAGLVDGRVKEGQQTLDVEVSSPLQSQ